MLIVEFAINNRWMRLQRTPRSSYMAFTIRTFPPFCSVTHTQEGIDSLEQNSYVACSLRIDANVGTCDADVDQADVLD